MTPVDYYRIPAVNDKEFESKDSSIVELIFPAAGIHYAMVESITGDQTGDYTMFDYRFSTVPEPTTIALGLISLVIKVGLPMRRRLA